MYINQSYFSNSNFKPDNKIHVLTKKLECDMLWFNYYREKKINLTLDNKIVNKTEIQKLELVLNTIYNDIAITKLSLTTIKNQKSKFKN
jgi:hypothetical protein